MSKKEIAYEANQNNFNLTCPKNPEHGHIKFETVTVGEPDNEKGGTGLLTTVAPGVGISQLITQPEDHERHFPSRRSHVKMLFSCESCHHQGSKVKDLFELFIVNHKGQTRVFWVF